MIALLKITARTAAFFFAVTGLVQFAETLADNVLLIKETSTPTNACLSAF